MIKESCLSILFNLLNIVGLLSLLRQLNFGQPGADLLHDWMFFSFDNFHVMDNRVEF
jgi:hypothetical protein